MHIGNAKAREMALRRGEIIVGDKVANIDEVDFAHDAKEEV